jgi:hypothetical protein
MNIGIDFTFILKSTQFTKGLFKKVENHTVILSRNTV